MNLIEAIKEAQETGKWFRPVKWRGCRDAFMIVEGKTEIVPDKTGGVLYMTPNVGNLVGDWEVVSPNDVLEGR